MSDMKVAVRAGSETENRHGHLRVPMGTVDRLSKTESGKSSVYKRLGDFPQSLNPTPPDMYRRIDTEADIAVGLNALLVADPRLAQVAAVAGPLPLRRRPGGFAGIAGIVVSQQLSTASASAIWGRLAAAYDPFTPQRLIKARADRLGRLGLSRPKIRALKEIARAIVGGVLDCEALADMPADAAHRALCAVHGIGPWTADIYRCSVWDIRTPGRPAI